MSRLTKTQNLGVTPRQRDFNFLRPERPERWRGLPGADQLECRRALAALLHQVISQQTENEAKHDEREDTNKTP
jgi:hypothetical protein